MPLKKLTMAERYRAGRLGVSFAVVGDRAASKDCFRAAFIGQWEGGEINRNQNRPGKRTVSQDTDLNYGMRERLLSEARALEQTFPIAKNIKEIYASHCVGKCHNRWNTGNPAHDASYREGWKNWMPIADVANTHHFSKLMRLAVGNAFQDGDMFVQLCKSNSYSQVNCIEADRVSSHGTFNNDTPDMIGGIGIFNGRPNKIRVWERTIYGMFQNPVEIPAAEYRHLFNTSRVDARRGVTRLHAVLNTTRNLKEIDAAAQLKTKRNAKLALIEKVISGQAPNGQAVVQLFGEPTETAAVNKQTVNVEDLGDAATKYTFTSEDVKAHEDPNTGNAIQHMEFMIRLIAVGCKLPFGVVWNMAGLGKPGVLFELEQASRTFSDEQDEIEHKLIRPIVGWWLAGEIAAKRQPFNPNWYKFQVGRPPDISIDAGRDSKSALAENILAMRSATSWYNETEDDFEEETERCFQEEDFRMQMKAKYPNVDMGRVRMLTPNGNPNALGDSDKQDQAE